MLWALRLACTSLAEARSDRGTGTRTKMARRSEASPRILYYIDTYATHIVHILCDCLLPMAKPHGGDPRGVVIKLYGALACVHCCTLAVERHGTQFKHLDNLQAFHATTFMRNTTCLVSPPCLPCKLNTRCRNHFCHTVGWFDELDYIGNTVASIAYTT